jgi:hypothetical protein
MRQFALVALAAISSCGGGPAAIPPDAGADRRATPRPVDVLVVQTATDGAQGLTSDLVRPIADAVAGASGLDVRIGVTTSNLGDFGSGLFACAVDGDPAGDGARLRVPPADAADCDPTVVLGGDAWPGFLAVGDVTARGDDALRTALSCVMQFRYVSGAVCKVVQPLEAAARAPSANPGFVREGSVLALLILMDVDDFSTRDGSLWGPEHNEEAHCFLGYRSPEFLVPVEEYVDRLPAAHADGPVVLGALTAPGTEVSYQGPGPSCPDGALAPSCQQTSPSFSAAPRLTALVAAANARGGPLTAISLDLCVHDHAPALASFMQLVEQAAWAP